MGSPTPPAAPGPPQPAPAPAVPHPPEPQGSQTPSHLLGLPQGSLSPSPLTLLPSLPRCRQCWTQSAVPGARLRADLAQVQQAHMTDADKALAKARDEGRAEAQQAAGLRVAAAEFVAAATGKLADPTAALELLDLKRFVGPDGEVDSKALGQYVDKLTAALPAPAQPGGKVPAGARGPASDGDFLGAMLR